MIYLATPYNHPDPAVRQARFELACRIAARFIRAGLVVFSPIAHSHPIVTYGKGLPVEWSYWEAQDRDFIERCDAVYVCMCDGWQSSMGVQAEIRIAQELGKPIVYITAEQIEKWCADNGRGNE
jgi:nucleoside 2-deoxyribosyltransferase